MADEIEKAVSDFKEYCLKTKAWVKEYDTKELFEAFDNGLKLSLTKSERELLIKRCQRNLAILSEGI